MTASSESPRARPRRSRFSSLNRRILAVNVLALAVFVAGVLYLDQTRSGLIETRLQALNVQADIIAGALGEAAISGPESIELELEPAAQIIRRLIDPQQARARLFSTDNRLLLDSRRLHRELSVSEEELPPPTLWNRMMTKLAEVDNWLAEQMSREPDVPLYVEPRDQSAQDFPEVLTALSGETATSIRRTESGDLILGVAKPVQRLKRVSGALLLTIETSEIEQIVEQERTIVWQVFGIALVLAILLSLYLARTIVKPVRRLADAAERIRHAKGRSDNIPSYRQRNDEIGELAEALKDMMAALYRRLDAIENFAADVSHELKNPLTSIRSAVETLTRTEDPERRAQLLEIVLQDVQRADRLISDIADASRLDAELSREQMEDIDLAELLEMTVALYAEKARPRDITVDFDVAEDGDFRVSGVPGPLAQVFSNLLDNALSFSPDGASIVVGIKEKSGWAIVNIDDEGPGFPEEIKDKIFERFYTERPEGEQFGSHSGLGLNICKQIIEVHGGRISAENLGTGSARGTDANETAKSAAKGARFTIELPLLRG